MSVQSSRIGKRAFRMVRYTVWIGADKGGHALIILRRCKQTHEENKELTIGEDIQAITNVR